MSSIDPERQKRAVAYARAQHLLLAANLTVLGTYVLAWLLTGLSRNLGTILATLTPFRPVLVALYLTLFALGYAVITFPLDFLAHRLSRRYDLSVQTFWAWLADPIASPGAMTSPFRPSGPGWPTWAKLVSLT
ncbi:MAG: hypothetical protein HY783_01035 [Chloroflexi bacterium]|nr:hypothetical protein [Chloroflexota bacterium]